MKKRIRPDDPEFTKLALGEATEEERAQWEIAPEDQAAFDELKAFSSELSGRLASAEVGGETLGDEREQSIRNRTESRTGYRQITRFPVWMSTLAACFAIGLVSLYVFHQDQPDVFYPTPVPLVIAPADTASDEGDETEADKEDQASEAEESNEIENRLSLSGDLNDASTESSSSANELRQLELATDRSELKVPEMPEPRQSAPQRDGESPGRKDFEQASMPQSAAPAPPEEREIFELSAFTVKAENASVGGSRSKKGEETAGTASYGFSGAEVGQSRRANALQPTPRPPVEPFNREGYAAIEESGYKSARDAPLSTFSIDVDTASYANARRFLESGRLPTKDAVRIEELVNYFRYDYAAPTDGRPFSTSVDAAAAPWNPEHRLVRIGLKGEVPPAAERPDANLVFLIDVSGSMRNAQKLPLVKESLKLLASQLEARDRIAIAVYAGASGLALPSTTANNQETIAHAIDNLRSGGSTNGGAGIELAYSVAQKHFIKDGINRVILCTDGDFNVGVSDQGSLTRMIEEKAKSGVFFTALGFGMGNLQDDMLETLSNKGNGYYGYIDSQAEARKLFVEEMIGSLQTIAKDVKIQVEFNPAQVKAYRLIGYENRVLNKEDFNDDTKDAGEIGAGHTVTAFYEVIPVGVESDSGDTPSVDPLKYQRQPSAATVAASDEMLTVKLRYKEPDEHESSLIETPFVDEGKAFQDADMDFRFAAAVVGFGMLLRDSEHLGSATFEWVQDTATKNLGIDAGGHRSAFLDLVRRAMELKA